MSQKHPRHDRPRPNPRRELGGAGFENLPAIIGRAGEAAARRFGEFLAATIRSRNTRVPDAPAVAQFFTWYERHRIHRLEEVRLVVVALTSRSIRARRTVKQHLAAIRMLFDFLGRLRFRTSRRE